MTPKEKAIELIDKFKIGDVVTEKLQIVNINIYSKLFALKAVDEIILSRKDDSQFDDTLWAGGSDMYKMHPMYLNYWVEVKQEIEKL